MKASILALPGLLALAACDGGTQGAGVTDEETTTEERAVAAGALSPEETAPTPATQIPPSIQGRWGLTSADCEAGRDDAKGLLAITGNKLEFYESVGTLGAVEKAEDSRIRAAFDFTGEGMSWKRDIALDLEDGGNTLIRRDYGEGAEPGPFRYAKCNQGN